MQWTVEQTFLGNDVLFSPTRGIQIKLADADTAQAELIAEELNTRDEQIAKLQHENRVHKLALQALAADEMDTYLLSNPECDIMLQRRCKGIVNWGDMDTAMVIAEYALSGAIKVLTE